MKLYRTRTQAEYDFLMQELEDEGFFWGMSKLNPTARNNFDVYGDRTIIRANTTDDTLAYGIDSLFPNDPIIEVSDLMDTVDHDTLMQKVMERNNKPESLKELTEPLDLIANHKRICERLNKVYADKNHDYGNSFGETYEKLGAISAVTRISDKTSRLQSLVTKDEQRVDDERLIDTALDLANYAIMFAMELEEEE